MSFRKLPPVLSFQFKVHHISSFAAVHLAYENIGSASNTQPRIRLRHAR